MHGTIDLDRAEPALEAPGLDRLIEKWLQDCEMRLPTDSDTAAGYRDKLRHFRRWWRAVGPSKGWVLRESDLIEFERHLRENSPPGRSKPLGYNTRKDALRRLRQMFRWASRKHFTSEYAHWVPEPQGEPPQRESPTPERIAKLFEMVEYSAWPTRDAAIIAAMAGMGVRRVECAGLLIEDITIDADGSGTAIIRYAKRTQRTAKRKRRARIAAFEPAAGSYLRALIDEMGHESGPLFRSIHNPDVGLTKQGVYKIAIGIIEDAGLRHVIKDPCHDLRRAFVTYWERTYRSAGPAMRHLLQEQVGHHSDEMTELYSGQGIEDVREVMVSPVPAMAEADAE